jgi:hypothetical protein
MRNPWKWIALGSMAMAGIVATSTLTTAYLMRPPAAPTPASESEPTAEYRAAVVRVAAPAPRSLGRAASAGAARVRPAAAVSDASSSAAPDWPVAVEPPRVEAPRADAPAAPAAVPAAPQSSVSSAAPVASAPSLPAAASAAADCETGGDRARRIAKPGALGAVLGAGLGAAGGAIASGGQGAGKGALIGGLAGAALGTGYGAYKTQHECGTIFGSGPRSSSSGVSAPGGAGAGPTVSGQATARDEVMAPLRAPMPSEGRIQVYDAR